MPRSVRAVLHRTTALCLADKNSTNWLQIQSRALICFCIAQADFRLRLLLPHPPEPAITGVHHHVWLHRWFYQPCRSSKLLEFLPSCCHWPWIPYLEPMRVSFGSVRLFSLSLSDSVFHMTNISNDSHGRLLHLLRSQNFYRKVLTSQFPRLWDGNDHHWFNNSFSEKKKKEKPLHYLDKSPIKGTVISEVLLY